jgi:hypothetical protein
MSEFDTSQPIEFRILQRPDSRETYFHASSEIRGLRYSGTGDTFEEAAAHLCFSIGQCKQEEGTMSSKREREIIALADESARRYQDAIDRQKRSINRLQIHLRMAHVRFCDSSCEGCESPEKIEEELKGKEGS